MKTYFHKIGAVFYGLWGLLHVAGGAALLQAVAAGGASAALAVLGTGVPAAQLPAAQDGLTAAVLTFFAFNWVWLGLFVAAVAVRLNWRNSPTGYWVNLAVVVAADLGLILTLLAPGYMALADGLFGPALLGLAFVFSTLGLLKGGATQIRQAAPA